LAYIKLSLKADKYHYNHTPEMSVWQKFLNINQSIKTWKKTCEIAWGRGFLDILSRLYD